MRNVAPSTHPELLSKLSESEKRMRRRTLGSKTPPDWGGNETLFRPMMYEAVGREEKDMPSMRLSFNADA